MKDVRKKTKQTKEKKKKESKLNLESKNTNRLYSDDESFFDLKLRKSLKNNQLTGK
jgi:hypothetical protein